MRLSIVDPQHEDRAPRVELGREVERAARVVERLPQSAQDEGVAIGHAGMVAMLVQRTHLRRREALAQPHEHLVAAGVGSDFHSGAAGRSRKLRHLAVEAQGVRVAGPGHRPAPIDQLAADGLGVGSSAD